MRRWQDVERDDEATMRALFARRARALAPPVLPSLEEVMRRAGASAPPPSRSPSARGRAAIASALAIVACAAAVALVHARVGAGRAIVADMDASAPATTRVAEHETTCDGEDDRGGALACAADRAYALASFDDGARACVDEAAGYSRLGAPQLCECEALCTIAGP